MVLNDSIEINVTELNCSYCVVAVSSNLLSKAVGGAGNAWRSARRLLTVSVSSFRTSSRPFKI